MSEVQRLIADGAITDSTPVWWEGLEGWTAFGECKLTFAPEFMEEEKRRVEALFREMDQDNSGTLDRSEVSQLSIKLGKSLGDAELDEAMNGMDTSGNGTVVRGCIAQRPRHESTLRVSLKHVIESQP